MKIVYIYHSGFAILGDNFTIIIDYYLDSDGNDESGILHNEILKRKGKFYVLSTHFHPDHFNKEILRWKEIIPDVKYILSKDILRHKRAQKEDAIWLKKGELYEDEILQVHAYGSTDVGCSFLIEIEGTKIFHAGDLNNWHWMDESDEKEWKGAEKNYLHELDYIYQSIRKVDIAIFPVDPRLGHEYMRGAKQFIEKIKTKIFIPMHFEPNYEKANAFKELANNNEVKFIELIHPGQIINI